MDRYGTHRSLDPRGVLPQQARVVDAVSPITTDEMAIDVEYLNVDSASWRQIHESCGGQAGAMGDRIEEIVAERGKLHNPVTGSGGMLVGRVAELGRHRSGPAIGTRVATLVSLSLTPLSIDEITELSPDSERVGIRGRAILFGSGAYAEVPQDLPPEVVLATLDVCGAPAWAARLTSPSTTLAVIGAGGKSGMLTCAQAKRSGAARIIGLCWPEDTVVGAKQAGAEAIAVDCTDPMAVGRAVEQALDGELADIVFVCANVAGCEGGAILACKDEGRVVFFSMATSFSSAALIAEGLGKSCELTIGNGYVPGHAELALDLVRSDDEVYAF
ncbi:MAG: L-erythro-3,5-diaminohexanoate dehydrogenase, partial [Actinomycetota bacterium]|nr:L-erythro-3,5-diaminohexanoate dehydrogenase [Actinomycetota bacterium]